MKLYITSEILWLLSIVYAPIMLWLLWKLWRALPKSLAVRVAVVVVGLAVAILIPLGDVLSTSIKMAELCPQAGVFVKRPVKAEGFYTNSGGPDMLKRGFKYVEAHWPAGATRASSKNPGHKVLLYEAGAEKREFDASTYQIKSRYEFIYAEENGAYEGRRHIGVRRSVARDRESGEELGYALSFTAYPGWIDQNTFGLLGKIMWHCQAHPDQDTRLLFQTLLPPN